MTTRKTSTAAATPAAQLFLPETRVPLEAVEVDLDALPADDALGCDPPRPALVQDIRAVGVLQPIILVRRGAGYTVADGRSRVRAARAAGLTTIPAVVAPEGHIAPLAVGAKANALRRDNPRTRLAFIEEATRAGLDDRAICRVGGFSASELRAARRIDGLIPPLREALDRGAIRAAVAREAAVLSVGEQETLATTLAETGKLGAGDVHAARQVDRASAAAALPASLFATPAPPALEAASPVDPRADADIPWRTDATALVTRALELVPQGEGLVRAALEHARAVLTPEV